MLFGEILKVPEMSFFTLSFLVNNFPPSLISARLASFPFFAKTILLIVMLSLASIMKLFLLYSLKLMLYSLIFNDLKKEQKQ